MADQTASRGWNEEEIHDVLDHPADSHDRARDWSEATVPSTTHYAPNGHYIVRNSNSGEVFHVIDRHDPGWIDNTDPTNPNQPIRPR